MKHVEIILRIGDTGRRRFLGLWNVVDVRNFVENYAPVKEFFIGDLSLLSKEAISILLKFLEERIENKIECYASRDNLPPVVLSRFTQVIKEGAISLGSDTFRSFVVKMGEGQYSSEIFIATSPGYLDKLLLYNHLPIGVKIRVGDLL